MKIALSEDTVDKGQSRLWISAAVAGVLVSPLISFFWINIDSEPNELAYNELVWAKRFSFLVSISCFLRVYKFLLRYPHSSILTPLLGSLLSNLCCITFTQLGAVFLIKPFELIYFWRVLAVSLFISFVISFISMFLINRVIDWFESKSSGTKNARIS